MGLASFHVFTVAARIHYAWGSTSTGWYCGQSGSVVSVSGREPVFCFVSETASNRVAHAGLELVVVLLPLRLRMDAGMTNVSYHSAYGSSLLCDGYICNRKTLRR